MNIFDTIDDIKRLAPEDQLNALNSLKDTISEGQRRQITDEAHSINPLWFRNALLKVLNTSNLVQPINVVVDSVTHVVDDTAYNIQEIRSDAVADSIGHIVHELSPIIGSLEVAAARELITYEGSRTKSEIGRLQELVDMFSAWRRAEQRPNYRRVNVSSLVREEVQRTNEKTSDVEIVVNIDEAFTFELDSSLVKTIISNALRNAVESTKQVTNRLPGAVIINSGCTDKHFWLSVIDDGIGLSESESVLLKSRFTTKPGNTGFGLSIVKKSISSMNGEWCLKNSLPHGAEFYFEVPHGEK